MDIKKFESIAASLMNSSEESDLNLAEAMLWAIGKITDLQNTLEQINESLNSRDGKYCP